MPRQLLRAVLTGALLLVLPQRAAARELVVPMRLDHAFLQQLLLTQVYTGPQRSVRMWDDGTGCNELVLSDPQVDTHDEHLRIRSAGRARAGVAVGGACLPLFDWTGTIEVLEEPVLDPAQPIVRFRVVDSNLYGADGTKSVTGTVWDWVKASVHPRLEAVSVDLAQPLAELRALLPLVLPREDAEQTARVLDSLSLAAPRAAEGGLVIDVRVDVPEVAALPTAPLPEPTLTPEELARWETAWQQWDAFLTFVSKQAAADAGAAQRQALLDVLIEARYDILWVLRPSSPNEPDPVPALFVKTWDRLAPVLRELSLGLPGEAAVRYLGFITAADALRAIQEMGPASGLDISADGLRRLARTIAPAATEDPLRYDERIDPELRELFGFGAPLPPPADNPDVDLSRWWWMPRPAWASDLSARLNRWAPDREDVQDYLPLARTLLNETARQTLAKQPLEDRFTALFEPLMLATAWKESCWRQYVRVGGRLTPLRSPVGAVGIMQVNPRVWRGFYDVKGLQQDIGYNATAGSEILLHYLRDYAIARGEHKISGGIDNLARATYAAYNGGPGHLTRYRKGKGKRNPGLRRIDESFWEKYRKVKGGDTLAVAECFGG